MRPTSDPRNFIPDRGSIVYVITHTESGQQYFGCTKGAVAGRWKAHRSASVSGKTPLYEALREYGHEAFTVEEVARFKWALDGFEYERMMMRRFNSFAPHGFNRKPPEQAGVPKGPRRQRGYVCRHTSAKIEAREHAA